MQKKGIDISYYQGNINFDAVSKEIDFAIIRCGWGAGHYDKNVDSYAVECASHNIPFGFYWFSYALTPEMAKQEADYICDKADKYNPTYPICFDYEGDSYKYSVSKGIKPDKALLKSLAEAFCNRVEERGYYAMIYTNIDYWNRGFGSLSSKYDIWLAQWKVSKPSKSCGIWQKSSTGKVSGINGNVDLDIAYKDYPVIINNMNKNKNKDKEEKEREKTTKLNLLKTEHWNEYLELANSVIAGDWGNGTARKRALNASGYDYNIVQKIVDIIVE